MSNIIYLNNPDNTERYALGVNGDNPLVCFGVNPSTATPETPDPTIKSVQRFANIFGFDGYIMLNLYPQRATDPNQLHKLYDIESINRNLLAIYDVVPNNATIWAAWGTLIEKRTYLFSTMDLIRKLLIGKHPKWVSIGQISKNGHPHHPLYLKNNAPMSSFDLEGYAKRFKGKEI